MPISLVRSGPVRDLIRLIVLIAVAALPSSEAVAHEGSERERPSCVAGNSVRVTIEEFRTNIRRLRNQCVGVAGYRLGDVIFADQRALYRYAARRPRLASGIVGIAYPGLREGRGAGLMRGVYYGRAEDCREAQRNFARTSRGLRQRRDSDEILLVHLYGFCATSEGPAIRADRADEQPADELRRMTGDGLRASLGELLPIPTNEDSTYSAILPWLIDLGTRGGCAGNFEAAAVPAGGPPEGEGVDFVLPNHGPRELERLSRWCASGSRERALFTLSTTSPSREPGTRLDILLCVCVSDDCAGRWPVALIDTGWGMERPYFCQRARLHPRTESGREGAPPEYSDYVYEFLDEWIVDEFWQDWGFPEP